MSTQELEEKMESALGYGIEITSAPDFSSFLSKNDCSEEGKPELSLMEDIKVEEAVRFNTRKIKRRIPVELKTKLGEELEDMELFHEEYVDTDTEPFLKVYLRMVQLLASDKICKEASILLYYIMAHLKPNDPRVYLEVSLLVEELGYKTRKSVDKGIKDLLEYNIIKPSSLYKNTYIVNPTYVCNGDRRKIYNKRK